MILGIDPGYARIGYAFLTSSATLATAPHPTHLKLSAPGPKLIEAGLVTTSAIQPFPERLWEIEKAFTQLLKRYPADKLHCAAVEKIFFKSNQKTALEVAHARGVLLAFFAKRKIPLREYTPRAIKKAITGRGTAAKQEVSWMATKLLGLREAVKQDDASDAVAIALCAYQTQSLLG